MMMMISALLIKLYIFSFYNYVYIFRLSHQIKMKLTFVYNIL